jgi:cell division protein FtsI (penicillin-binding protein 3)
MRIRRTRRSDPNQLSLVDDLLIDGKVRPDTTNREADSEANVLPPGSTRIRNRIVMGLVVVWVVAMIARLGYLQVYMHDEYSARMAQLAFRTVTVDGPRGTIYDARGRELAISIPAISVWADPTNIDDGPATLKALDKVLRLEAGRKQDLLEALESNRNLALESSTVRTSTAPDQRADSRKKKTPKQFVWLKRQVEPEYRAAIEKLGLSGIHLLEEPKRYYPYGDLARHLLGNVGVDHDGLAGLELVYDEVVKGVSLERTLLRSPNSGYVLDERTIKELAENGEGADLHLTLDASLQYLAERELDAMVEKTRARSGSVVVLDARDSAILAMASSSAGMPATTGRIKNHAIESQYPPGSTFKMITAAAALEEVVFQPDDLIDCEMGGLRVGRLFIRDHRPFGVLTFREVLEKSSNVGVMKATLKMGSEPLLQKIQAFGIGDKTGVDLQGESGGQLQLSQWRGKQGRTKALYASFGQGIGTTPIQMANAFAALANGGERHRPYIVRVVDRDGVQVDLTKRALDGGSPTAGQVVGQPITRQTAATLLRMLEGVVAHGTGTRAQVPGYLVAGKTGTSEKEDQARTNKDRKIASFAGIVPARDPRLVALIVLDEPRGLTHGGTVAAPVFASLMREGLLYLGIPPTREQVDPADPAAGQQIAWLTLPEQQGMPGQPGLVPTQDATADADSDSASLLSLLTLPERFSRSLSRDGKGSGARGQ